MCGIVGYAGSDRAAPILLEGLKKLEYRGYDSSGLAVVSGPEIKMVKTKGRLANLCRLTDDGKNLDGSVGIGHTRWATHGEPSDLNSHPHISPDGRFAVVHNGIIENYLELKEFLTARGFRFLSETDTEAVALLTEYYFSGDMIDTLQKVANKLRGSYALGVLFSQTPDAFYAVRKDSPLVVGLGKGANYIASDMPALLSRTRSFILLEDDEIALVGRNVVRVYDRNKEIVPKEPFEATWDESAAEKDGYPHFMLKEIHEQPKALQNTIKPHIKNGKIDLGAIKPTADYFKNIAGIDIVACGSAYHAGVVGKYFIEELARVPVGVDLASEFRYRRPITGESRLTVIISQSGETADTLAALREAKRAKSKTLAIVNVIGSSIAREADEVFYTLAGPEIAVATTKGYTTQLAALCLIGLYIADARGAVNTETYAGLAGDLLTLPDKVNCVLKENVGGLQYLSSVHHGATHAFFIGRGRDYAAAMEGSLKLKEISYIHAEAYAAGELKHGTISLIENGSLVVAVCTEPALAEKTLSNIREVKSRGAHVLALTANIGQKFAADADSLVVLPDVNPLLSPVLSAVALQLLGYYISAARGCDIDKPRNLAKSVTVE
ncbi:MAG: glutamine--fructose-6-phosphate transaminase (isomerizing) [Clostridiales bacterium]|jgi:glucosamine--fructose-6-phosphate aminotransferase (isomerizing)|nr:glutamine--fructose-6-phosphate transaminase (isomerizing) [Clostridiales bacterium]